MGVPGNNAAPVIIKRKKVTGGDGHHGGAWKVAYADFVTAMMAFFLLMWLLNATTEKQRKGIADYFSPTVAVNRISGGGDGSFGGDSVFTEETLARNGTGASNRNPTRERMAQGQTGAAQSRADATSETEDQEALKQVEDMLTGRSGESLVSPEMHRHIRIRVTDEGLIIELFDLEEARLFDTESDAPTQLLQDLAMVIVSVSDLVENPLAIEAHAHARPVVVAQSPVWDLSSQRANMMRQLMTEKGLEPNRVNRITGHGDREPAVSNPFAIRNNRLEVILLRSDT